MRNRHVLYDAWVADTTLLERVPPLEALLTRAALAGGATILHGYFHPFAPCGVTGFLLLAESHLSVHTWPEKGYAAFDVFMCGDAEPRKALGVFKAAFNPGRIVIGEHKRGVL